MAQASPFTPEPFGPYLLLGHLGRGGMADVYKARVEGVAGFSRNVVVKRILKVHTQEPHFVEMFINEAKIAARLSHPNIVQVYELGEVDGELFIAMEYVRGVDLLRLMRAAVTLGGPPPPKVGAFIVREVARALAHAHEYVDENQAPRPIIHRDVSPQNVMVGHDGQVKLVDFGIAKAVTAFQEGTRTGSLKGKFGYMAPEQIDSGNCTPQTDIFSAGVVLFEVLTAKRLFKGQTDYDTMNKVKHAPLVPPSSVLPGIDPELDRVVLMALARDPAQRFTRAGQLARELDLYLQKAEFGQEEMAAWMKQMVPKEEVQAQLPLGAGTPSRSQLSRSPGGTSGKRPGDGGDAPAGWRTPSVSIVRGAQTPAPAGEAVAGSGQAPRLGDRRPLPGPPWLSWSLGGVLLLLSALGVAWILRPTPPPPAPQQPERQHQGSPPPPGPGVHPAPQGAGQAPFGVMLESDPPGAMVYVGGTRRLGVTPLRVELAGESLDLVLTLPGRPDLAYSVHRTDGTHVVLRLPEPKIDAKTDQRAERRRRHPSHGEDPAQRPPETPTVTQQVAPQQPVQQPQQPTLPKRIQVKPLDEDDSSGKKPIRPLE